MCLLAVPALFLGLIHADSVCVALCRFGDAESRNTKGKMSCGNLQLGSWCDLQRELFPENYCLAFNVIGASLVWNVVSSILYGKICTVHPVGGGNGPPEISRPTC